MATKSITFAKQTIRTERNEKCDCGSPDAKIKLLGPHKTHYCKKCFTIYVSWHLSKEDYEKEKQLNLYE
jgi:hypothetical protein